MKCTSATQIRTSPCRMPRYSHSTTYAKVTFQTIHRKLVCVCVCVCVCLYIYIYIYGGPASISQYSDSLRDRIPVGGEIFRTRPGRPRGVPSLLCNGCRDITGVKRQERGVNHPSTSLAKAKERVESYLTSTPLLCLHGRLYGELYLYIYIHTHIWS
jgi:hypothetical protein